MAKNDERIKELIKITEAKKAALGTKPKAAWKTNGIFKVAMVEKHLNLNTVNNVETLVDALAALLIYRTSIQEAEKILGLQLSERQHDGYPLSDWVADFKLRISMIKYDEEKKKIEALETQLKSLISEDCKTEMALDEITKSLGI